MPDDPVTREEDEPVDPRSKQEIEEADKKRIEAIINMTTTKKEN